MRREGIGIRRRTQHFFAPAAHERGIAAGFIFIYTIYTHSSIHTPPRGARNTANAVPSENRRFAGVCGERRRVLQKNLVAELQLCKRIAQLPLLPTDDQRTESHAAPGVGRRSSLPISCSRFLSQPYRPIQYVIFNRNTSSGGVEKSLCASRVNRNPSGWLSSSRRSVHTA